jgi:sulfite exporter TauE/SafE
MENVILVAFITGLTAGGLSCYAVQGGLLSGTIAQRMETDLPIKENSAAPRRKNAQPAHKGLQAGMIQPILQFMAAKLIAYTILGFFLGWIGSLFTFSPMLQGAIQLAIGIFLMGNALRMLNVHPIFRYFSFEPPSQFTRHIRRVSKQDDWITPVYLGALTVLIPCGVTQSMMAVAIVSGDPALGAAIMFAFVLGTSPAFIGVSWLATSLGSLFQRYFYRVVAVIVLVMGLVGVNAGLTLMGSPISASKVAQAFRPEEPVDPVFEGFSSNSSERVIVSGDQVRINVVNEGYSPNHITLPADQSIEVRLVTENTYSCARAFVIPELDVMEMLPETGETVIKIPAQKSGKKMDFMCSMGMYTGIFEFK